MRDYAAADGLLDLSRVVECHLFELRFASGTARYNDTGWDLDWNGNVFYGRGDVIQFSAGAEDLSLEAYRATLTTTALNPAKLGQALSERVRGRRGTIYHCVFNPDTFAIVGVEREFSGWLSGVTVVSGDA